MDYALNSIQGKRDNQEDYGAIKSSGSSGGVLAVIADGMGGQVAGEVASSGVVNEFIESFFSNNSKNLPLKLNMALDKANRSLAKSISLNPKLKGMGATLVAAQIDDRGIGWISVGDSVLYLYRDKKLLRLNDDHSMKPILQESVRNGRITHEEARVHPHRNALRSAVTGEDISIIDLREDPLALKSDDLIILATDGILTLSDLDIGAIIEKNKKSSAKIITDQLLKAVIQVDKPRQDNTLVGVVRISSSNRFSKLFGLFFSIFIFLVVGGLTFLIWENESIIFNWFSSHVKQESASEKNPEQKVSPIVLDDAVPIDKSRTIAVTNGQIPVSVSTPSADIESVTKSGKSISEKKASAGSKVSNKDKLDVATRAGTLDVGAQQPISINPEPSLSGEMGVISVPPAKVDQVPKRDGPQVKPTQDFDNPNVGKIEFDRKE